MALAVQSVPGTVAEVDGRPSGHIPGGAGKYLYICMGKVLVQLVKKKIKTCFLGLSRDQAFGAGACAHRWRLYTAPRRVGFRGHRPHRTSIRPAGPVQKWAFLLIDPN